MAPVVAVFSNTLTGDEAAVGKLMDKVGYAYKIFHVDDWASLCRAVRKVKAGGSQTYVCVVNLCSGPAGDGNLAATAALFLERCGVPYSGCRAAILGHPLDVTFMMMWYAGLPLPAFRLVRSAKEAEQAAAALTRPVRISSGTPLLGSCSEVVGPDGDVAAAAERLLGEYGPLVAWEVRPAAGPLRRVWVTGGAVLGRHAFPEVEDSEWGGVESQMEEWAQAYARDVLDGSGAALLSFRGASDPSGEERWVLEEVSLNAFSAQVAERPFGAEVMRFLVRDAEAHHDRPSYAVRLHEDSRKGYHLCATRDIKKGEVIFQDECRSFAIVTKPFVERNWDAALQKTFSEYAWPLDSEGHTYAIWEKEPTRWRPINHSCDPNAVFDAPHSLNVIAARNISEGEDLSMDYMTFCDHTMKPFDCLCGSPSCRGRITFDKSGIEKYGQHAWLRR